MNLPSGTITFLFTDIEGSTLLWEQDPSGMQEALAQHDVLLRRIIEQHEGMVFKTVGDAFCAAFPVASHALAAALSAQLVLQQGPLLRVRMALHTGAVESRDNDYFGRPLNRVARLLAIGHGGQVLLSQVTQELVQDQLSLGIHLENLGEHRLKDLGRPETVFQLCHPALQRGFPPLRSLGSLPNNLPQQLTSFVGRDRERQQVQELLEKTRLLTLTGSGGCGKTRLALQVAADLLDGFGDGVWLVELAALTAPNLLPQEVANALKIREEPGTPILQTVVENLTAKQLLLVLDNGEHLLAACANLTNLLLQQCPHVVILVTSREPLGILGELTYRVPSLSLPDQNVLLTPQSLEVYEATRLFLERATFHLPEFALTPQNTPAIASLCWRLDGIPLAIELAAARVKVMSVEEVNQRLDQRFRLLTSGSRTALPRQQTLRSLIDWSYELLSETEKLLLQRLAVFAGGWSLEAAESICSGRDIEDFEVLDLLSSLVDKSLVQAESVTGATRYHFLETVRQYAREKLIAAGDAEDARYRHLDYFLALAEEGEQKFRGPQQLTWLDTVQHEYDNFRVAIAFGRESGSQGAERGLRLCGALWRFWYIRGPLAEGSELLTAHLSQTPAEQRTASRATALNGAGVLASQQGHYEQAFAYLQENLALRRELDDLRDLALALNNLATVGIVLHTIKPELALFQQVKLWFEEGLQIVRTLQDDWATALLLSNLAELHLSINELIQAQAFGEESLVLRQRVADSIGMGQILTVLGKIACSQERFSDSYSYLKAAMMARRDIGDEQGVAETLEALGGLWAAQNELHQAACLWGSAEVLREQIGSSMAPNERAWYDRFVAQARAGLTEADFSAAWAHGRLLTWEQTVKEALDEDF